MQEGAGNRVSNRRLTVPAVTASYGADSKMKVKMAKTVIVTGGGYGIGRATALLLANDGWNVISFDANEAHNRETLGLIEASGGTAVAVTGDVADAKESERACSLATERFGELRGLVNCAAMRHPGSAIEITESQWDETVNVCLKGTFLFCKAALPHMIAAGGGAIVNVSSRDAYGVPGMIAYSAAKAGVEALTRCLAVDHVKDRVRVNAIIPPFTVTGMTENWAPERIARASLRSPTGRPALPADVANLAGFLLSDEAALFTSGIFGGIMPPSN